MENQKTMTKKEKAAKKAAKKAEALKFTTYDYAKARVEMQTALDQMDKKDHQEYYNKRASEFYERYNWNAEPSKTATILTKHPLHCMMVEFDVWVAQKEQYMNYMGCHKASTFSEMRPTELLKEFGEWLINSSEHAEWDYDFYDNNEV